MPSVTSNKLLGYSTYPRLHEAKQRPILQRPCFEPLRAIPLVCHFGTLAPLTYQRTKLKQL